MERRPTALHYFYENERLAQTPKKPFSKGILGQGVCAGLASCFQVYSGGIVLDTVSTRLQARWPLRASLYGANATSFRAWQLFAGHAVVAVGRFPYLFATLATYAQTERFVVASRPDGASLAARPKGAGEEAACIAASSVLGSALITVVEAPKVMAQLSGGAHSCASVAREFGLGRLLRGYEATLLRESVFQVALLGAPALARRCDASADASSFLAGAVAGFLSNPADALKTKIQAGEYRGLGDAWRGTLRHGGLRPLVGGAACVRALYTAHAVLAVNFARFRVEAGLDRLAS